MTGMLRRVLDWLAGLIDGFAPAEGPPPRALAPFFRWCLSGAWPVIWVATVLFGHCRRDGGGLGLASRAGD